MSAKTRLIAGHHEIGHSHKYKPTSLKLIGKVGPSAWILDVGGGNRNMNLPNFVNVDIIKGSRYVTVVADAHFLPFRHDIFDLVLCEAAIEHFRYPWIAVDQIFHVLKKNGWVYADVAFMQPVHSYPNHFFNMTLEGVKVLFERFTTIDCGVQDYQMPSYTLQFVLSRYLRCLFPGIDKSSKNIEVYDTGVRTSTSGIGHSIIIRLYDISGRILRSFDRLITREKAQEIAAGVYLLGKKQ